MMLCQYEVASHLGMTVAQLARDMTMEEFIRWVAFLRIEPRKERRFDVNIAWLIMNMRRLVGDKNPKFNECILQFTSASSEELPKEAKIKQMAEGMKAFVCRMRNSLSKKTK